MNYSEKIFCSNQSFTLITGIILLGSGFLALATLPFTTLFSTVFLGWLFIISGFMQLGHYIRHYRSNHSYLLLLNSLLSIATGTLILYEPILSIVSLTMIAAFFFIITGLSRTINTVIKYSVNGKIIFWSILNGLSSLILGVMLLSDWPGSSAWFIGLYVAIDLIFTGWAFILFYLSIKKT